MIFGGSRVAKAGKTNEFEIGDAVYYVSATWGKKIYGIVRHIGKLPLYGRPTQMVGKEGCVWSEWERIWDGQINSCSLGWMPKDEVYKAKEGKMREFKKGDRIKQIRFVSSFENPYAVVTGVLGNSIRHKHDGCEGEGSTMKENLILVEESKMSKYQELKERIKNVQGWGKEADDIISEMRMKDAFSIDVKMCWNEYKNSNEGYMEAYLSGEDANPFKEFHFKTQCEKLEAFKLALLWLLDHSDIKKDENHIKIMQLKVRKSIVCSEIVSLNKQIAELEK